MTTQTSFVVDTKRSLFIEAGANLLLKICRLTRMHNICILHVMYKAYRQRYHDLPYLLRMYDSTVITINDGIESALTMYCRNDSLFDRVFEP